MNKPSIHFSTPITPFEFDELRAILREYAQSIQVDLCFQNFEDEIATLPGEYVEPRGALLMARVNGELVGCCALRPLDNVDYPNACEMKRLYVRKAFRKLGIGRQLVEAIMDCARLADYDEDNPAKLVAGYGGTINLMVSLLFTALLLVGAAFPLLPGSSALGPWRWIVGAGWTLVVTGVWSTIFLRMSWSWFARLG